ncbi:hypothetical protein CHS0354_029336 [Potamilus streckersoni]|uniref:NAD(P)H oxidase (H2O2-forming) n=1 Tax=Potamilus streckersoni TaxID=2493646 RepID=A0AAE0W652_9BIVA|nr:hypothetical protein CHS0354_029336 [Potamilus streckersoni]
MPGVNQFEVLIPLFEERQDKKLQLNIPGSPRSVHALRLCNTYWNPQPIRNLRRVYGNTSKPDNVDIFPAGLLETTPEGVGETFRAIILVQFLRIRHSDRFWFENTKNGLFTEDEIEEIWNVTICDIITKVTHIGPDDIQWNPLLLRDSPCQQPKQLVADGNETFNDTDNTLVIEQCTPLKHYDYFAESQVSFILTFLGLGLCVPIAFGVLIFMAKYRQQRKMEAVTRDVSITQVPGTFLKLEKFLKSTEVDHETHMFSEAIIFKDTETKENRKELLDKVFRVVCLQAFKQSSERVKLKLDLKLTNDISKIQLTRTEFADALGLRSNSVFLRNMFLMVDRDAKSFVSFHQFMDMYVILARGNAEEKAKFLVSMNDLKGQGYLTKADFGEMIK